MQQSSQRTTGSALHSRDVSPRLRSRMWFVALFACLVLFQTINNFSYLTTFYKVSECNCDSGDSSKQHNDNGDPFHVDSKQSAFPITTDESNATKMEPDRSRVNSESIQRNDVETSFQDTEPVVYKNPPLKFPPGRKYMKPALRPKLGKHRRDAEDAVFSMATGYEIDDHLMAIGSLLATNYTGDIVLGINDIRTISPSLRSFLQYHSIHSNLVVYTIQGCIANYTMNGNRFNRCFMKNAYKKPFSNNAFNGDDKMSGRHQSQRKFRYEYYWIWLTNYSPTTRILVTDFRDVVFQTNPFNHWSIPPPSEFSRMLFLFEESDLRRITERDRFTAQKIKLTHGSGMIDHIGNQTVLCSGVNIGGKVAMEQYLLLMIWDMDNFMGNENGRGDQAHHNVIYYTGELQNQTGVDTVKVWQNFEGAVGTTGNTHKHSYGKEESLITGVTDKNGALIPIVHQFDRSRELKDYFELHRDKHWKIEAERLTGEKMVYIPSSETKI